MVERVGGWWLSPFVESEFGDLLPIGELQDVQASLLFIVVSVSDPNLQ